ncbi:hypothetical protein RchiOBHm_Chr5g0052361 [Rosa chinensis]|uniref:Uncharacterized protein n=1 Tax=Rosa chinensis TaxID=74649 RepID=A0A2P6QFN5_ROSCH|nr:hypothetical protein RchiOBHm_Chr5g0052361 [Rosa chinensis]
MTTGSSHPTPFLSDELSILFLLLLSSNHSSDMEEFSIAVILVNPFVSKFLLHYIGHTHIA